MPKKILLVAMPSSHFKRWVSIISNAGFELYWFDILNGGYQDDLKNVTQITNWKKRKVSPKRGEYFLYKKWPSLYKIIEPLIQVTAEERFKQAIEEIEPDMVHSFEMQACSYPIYKTMQSNNIKWLYSCWGSDIYYYRRYRNHLKKIKQILKRIDFLHTDCKRDFKLAKELGFHGHFFGVYLTGGGYDTRSIDTYLIPFEKRNIIFIKGYEHYFGRAINTLKAINLIKDQLSDYEIVVFSAHNPVKDYVVKNLKHTGLKIKVLLKDHSLPHEEFLKLMGASLIYVGNSTSDGMPNTLIEALCYGVFPIQSNPGGATEEVLEHKKNGLLIEDPNNIKEISEVILYALSNLAMVKEAFTYNSNRFKQELDLEKVKIEIIESYNKCLNN